MGLDAKRYAATELAASAARTANGNGDAVRLGGALNGVSFVLDLTAAATAAGDLLDVYVQTKLDATNWVDAVHFTQCLGNGGAKRYISKIAADTALTEFENAAALGEHTVRNLLGDDWRVRWVVTSADTPSFTFSLTACPM